ncbi:MAG: ATP-binding protein, partial [Candidatus Krumholzibacteria bacterium]|nr:ATP-binding protein [Candidatus Krumholzibacteria bacterium]
AMNETLAEIWNNEGTDRMSCRLLKAEGDELAASITAHVVVQDEQAYLVIFVSEAADFSAEQSRFAAMARSRFVADLTHELRTPLNALIGMSDLLVDMNLGEEPRDAARMVADSAKGLLGLVNDVLDFAKIEAGKMEMRHRPFELERTLQGLSDTFALQVHGKKLCYSLKIDRNVPASLIGDEGRLRQILVNLVGNALKFTDHGGVTLDVRLEETVDPKVKILFSVIDTGCGIADNERDRLFEAFTQVGDSAMQSIAGTGLGLTISRQLVNMMGGNLGMTSVEGHGSTFWFSLPFDVEAVASLRKSSFSDEHRQLHVLIAEDNKVNQKVALGMMRKLGYTGVAADNGEHALELLRTDNFDVVFMDLQMPKMGGLEATVRIRAGEAKHSNREVPIVAMTGNASQQDRQDCLDAGMNGYLTKPVSSERILEAVISLGSSTEEKDGRGAPFSMAGLIEQMNGDTELADEILEIFCEDTEDRIQRMAAAVTNYKFEAIKHEAQALEGGALNVRAEILVHLAREMRRAATNQEQETVSVLIDEMVMELASMLQGA